MIGTLIFLYVRFFGTFKPLCLHPPLYFEHICHFPLSTKRLVVRIGPSASEAAHANDPLVGLVANLTQVKMALADPSVREVVANIAPQLLEIFPVDGAAAPNDLDVRNAKAGLPSSSKPASPTKSPPLPVDSPADPKPEKPAFTPLPSGEKPSEEVNSATHRAAHARLVRRMEKINPASFPNMSRLWNGNRKDTLGSLNTNRFPNCVRW